jgi:hypothetical protein
MKHYEERKYKSYTICIEFYGKTYTSKDGRKYFVKDKNGKVISKFRESVYKTLEEAKYVIDSNILYGVNNESTNS